MDTQKLHDLIDKVIGKDGPLRTPAYWMRRVLKGIVGRIDEKAEEVKSEIDNELKGKLDRAISLTYKEFRNMCYKKAGIMGQYYHISDYKPTLSELQEGFDVMSPYEGKLYVKYNGVKIYNQFRDFCDTIFKGYVFTDEKTYEVDYILHDSNDALGNKWMMGPFESFDTIVVSDRDFPEVINNLTLRNKASIEGKSEWWLFEDALTQEEYEVWNYDFESNALSLSLRKVGDSMIYHYVKIVDYTFRTYGSILRMKDCTQNLEVCYDFIGLSWQNGVKGLKNSKITGYYSGFLPRVTGGTSSVIDGVEIINSDNIRLSGDYQMYSTKLRIVECHDVYCGACDNVVLDNCSNASISKAKDCYFYNCHDIESTDQLYSSSFMDVSSKKIEYVYNSFLHSVSADEISKVVGIGFDDVIGGHVAIKDGQMYSFYKNKSYSGSNPVYPKTTTSAVIDEATGKTLVELIEELEARLNTLEGN